MKKILFSLLALGIYQAEAQISNTFFGLARKNTPQDEVFLATVNPTTGLVTNVNNTAVSGVVNLTGAALDPYNQLFHFIGYNTLYSVNLQTGNVMNSPQVNAPFSDCYFDNFRFNNSDSLLYGLARQVYFDTVANAYVNNMYLATINATSGTISAISPTSIGMGFALAGSAINPYLKVFYYSDGSNLIGLDMYTGAVYSSAPITITNGIVFDNFTYSCVDSALYGLIRQNYYDSIYDPSLQQYVTFVDSTTIHLGKINPATGVVTTISPYSIAQGGYALNAGSTIDPNTMTFYYNNGGELVGVNMVSGLITSNPTLSYSNGQFFDLMRFQSNCYNAKTPIRTNPNQPSAVSFVEPQVRNNLYPNPGVSGFVIESNQGIAQVSICNFQGQVIKSLSGYSTMKLDVSANELPSGLYLIRISSQNGAVETRKWMKQ